MLAFACKAMLCLHSQAALTFDTLYRSQRAKVLKVRLVVLLNKFKYRNIAINNNL